MNDKIQEGVAKRKMAKMEKEYMDALGSTRNYRQIMYNASVGCIQPCLNNLREDDLTQVEKNCLQACFAKRIEFNVYAKGLFTAITNPEVYE